MIKKNIDTEVAVLINNVDNMSKEISEVKNWVKEISGSIKEQQRLIETRIRTLENWRISRETTKDTLQEHEIRIESLEKDKTKRDTAVGISTKLFIFVTGGSIISLIALGTIIYQAIY